MKTKAEPVITDVEPVYDRSRSIGAILIEQGTLKPQDIDEIQRYAGANGIRFGDAAVHLRRLTQNDVELAIAQQFNYPVLPRDGEHGVARDVVAAYDPQSEVVESLRVLRSQLILRWRNNTGRKVLAITSPQRREGRSWVAANLATIFAQLGERTLLIDADLRNPRQHELFNLDNSVGLSALLTGRAGREIVRRVHPQLRLFVLCAGIVPPNPQELLGRAVFDLVLNRFAEQYDVVIVDTPAATETADAQILAARAGSAIILVRKNHTQHSKLVAAMQSLTGTGVNLVGSVISEH